MFCSLKMKPKIFLNNFLIIMCVTISFITCRPCSPSDDENDILKECLEEMGCKLDTNHGLNLNSSSAKDLRWELNAKMWRMKQQYLNETAILKQQYLNEPAIMKQQYLNETAILKLQYLNETAILKLQYLNETAILKLQYLNDTEILKLQLLNKTHQLEKEVIKHKWKSDLLQAETHIRILYQSYVSIYEFIDRLFAEKWPQWASNKPNSTSMNERFAATWPQLHPKQPNSTYTDEQWRILLSNVENSLILAIRTNLEKEKIPVQDFIQEAQKICAIRNIFVSVREVNEKERQKAIEIWRKRTPLRPGGNSNVMTILLHTPELTPLPEFEDTVTKQVNEERADYILMKIPNFYGWEDNLEWNLMEFYKNHSGNETKFNGLAVDDDSAYVTFENFQSAHFLWEKWVNKRTIPIDQKDAVILSGYIPLMKEKKSNSMFVKLEINENDLLQFERDVLEKIQEEIRPESRETLPKKYKEKPSSGIEIFYRFQTAYPAIRFYSLCKKERLSKKKEPSWTITFHSFCDFNLIPYADVTNILARTPPNLDQPLFSNQSQSPHK